MRLLAIVVAGGVLFALIAWFYTLELRQQRHKIFVVLVVTVLVEALLAGRAADVPVGILRPRVAGQDFRPPDAVIIAALIARTLQWRGRRVQMNALVWAAFIGVYLTGIIAGLLHGIPAVEVFYQGKAAFYLVGGITIAAGADPRRLTESVAKLAMWLAVLVPVAFVVQTTDAVWSFSTPVQRFNRLGGMSNDTITLVTLIGAVTLIAEATRERRRLKVAVAGVVLMMAPAVGQQRASYLVVGAVGLVFALVVLGRTWRVRATATGVEIGLIAAGLAALVVTGVLITSSPGVIIAPVQEAFGGEVEQRTTQARISLYDQAIDKIAESPVVGSGVGTKVTREAVIGNRESDAAAHNIFLDLGMRVGLVGVAAYLTALWTTMRHGVGLWRRAREGATATVAMAGLLLIAGALTKSLVEPALDKFRLALALAIGVGLVMAAQRADDEATPGNELAVEPTRVRLGTAK